MPPLLTPHALSKLAPDEAPSKIRVKNLQTTLPLTDAWGRPATQQPVLISASISLHRPFSSSADTDSVTKGTVHYGILSKAILKACKEFEEIVGFGDEEGLKVPMWGRAVVCWLHYCLTGHDVLPKIPHIYISSKNIKTSKTGEPIKPLLSAEDISLLEIKITLPKASLLGSGVSLKGSFLYEGNGTEGPCAFSMDLKLHDLRMAALLGVNANEKLAKQIVICGVEMEKWDRVADSWAELEEIVAKTIEESTFQTLEALATFLTTRIITYFIMPHFSHPHPPPLSSPSSSLPHNHPQIRITLSKPTAVTFADFPVVELCTDTDPGKNELADRCWKELGRVKKPPFPLQGRLDDWLMFQGFEDYKDEF